MKKERTQSWELGLFAPSVSQLTPAQTAALVSQAGYRWIEWRVQTLEAIESSPWGRAYNTLALDNLESEARQVASTLSEAGVETCGLQVDAPAEDKNVLPVVLKATQILGCRLICLHAPHFDPRLGYHAQRDAFRAVLSSWVKRAEDRGMRICVENHFGSIAPSVSLTLRMLEGFDPALVGVVWDQANAALEGSAAPALSLDQLGPYLAEVHTKDGAWQRGEDGKWSFNWCDLGDGLVDWPEMLSLLHRAKYTGPLVIEDYRPISEESKLTKARDYLQKTALSLTEP